MAAKYYYLQEYVKKGYDFNSIFPEKVDEVQKLTNMLFTLQDIVNYLQKQTNDFKIENPVAKDLDNSIYNLVLKYEKKSEPQEPEEEEDYVTEWASSADLLYDLLSGDTSSYDASMIEEWKAALDLLVSLLEDKNYDSNEIKKFKSVL